jgi:vesicle-fusing ATPase
MVYGSMVKLIYFPISMLRQVLEDMEMLSAFTAILHVPNISLPEHLLAVLEESDVFSKKDLSSISHKIHGYRYMMQDIHIAEILLLSPTQTQI